MPTARTWFGYAALWTCALIANQEKTLDAVKLARALQGFALPPDVALMPGKTFYRAEDHQFMPAQYVGHAQSKGTDDPEDLFVVDQVLNGAETAPAGFRDRLQAVMAGLIALSTRFRGRRDGIMTASNTVRARPHRESVRGGGGSIARLPNVRQ